MNTHIAQKDVANHLDVSSSAISQARKAERPVKGEHLVHEWAVEDETGQIKYDPPAEVRAQWADEKDGHETHDENETGFREPEPDPASKSSEAEDDRTWVATSEPRGSQRSRENRRSASRAETGPTREETCSSQEGDSKGGEHAEADPGGQTAKRSGSSPSGPGQEETGQPAREEERRSVFDADLFADLPPLVLATGALEEEHPSDAQFGESEPQGEIERSSGQSAPEDAGDEQPQDGAGTRRPRRNDGSASTAQATSSAEEGPNRSAKEGGQRPEPSDQKERSNESGHSTGSSSSTGEPATGEEEAQKRQASSQTDGSEVLKRALGWMAALGGGYLAYDYISTSRGDEPASTNQSASPAASQKRPHDAHSHTQRISGGGSEDGGVTVRSR